MQLRPCFLGDFGGMQPVIGAAYFFIVPRYSSVPPHFYHLMSKGWSFLSDCASFFVRNRSLLLAIFLLSKNEA
jgi:hypothetical protein